MLHQRVLERGIAMDVVRSAGTRTPHRHTCLEIVFVHAGTTVWSVQGESRVLTAGEVLVFNAEAVHSSRPVHGEYVRTGIHFLPELAPPAILSLLPGPDDPPWHLTLSTTAADNLFAYAQRLRTLTRHAPRHRRIRDLLARILDELAHGQFNQPEAARPDEEIVRAAVSYMASHLEHEEALESLAARVYVSEGHLCHVFRKRFGCSPKRLWQIMKIEKICSSPQIKECSVDELARKAGFETRRGFERAFRRVTGTTVTEYRGLLG